jgi:hypothetical protein
MKMVFLKIFKIIKKHVQKMVIVQIQIYVNVIKDMMEMNVKSFHVLEYLVVILQVFFQNIFIKQKYVTEMENVKI